MPYTAYPNRITETLSDFVERKGGEQRSVRDFGARGDAKAEIFVATTAASTTASLNQGTGTGTISSSGIAVTGVSTTFLSEVHIGGTIIAAGEARRVAAVLSQTALLVESAFSVDLAGSSFTVTSTGFVAADVGKVIGIFGAGTTGGTVVPIFALPMVDAPTSDSWTVMKDYSGTVPVALDTLGSLSARFTVTCRFNDIEWEVFGSNASDFSGETSVHGPAPVVIADGEVGGRDLHIIATAPTYRYYRIKTRNLVAGETAHGFGHATCFGYLHYSTIASVTSPVEIEMSDAASVSIATAQAYYGTLDDDAIEAGLRTMARLAVGSEVGGVLHLPTGGYLVSRTVVIPNKVQLVGEGLCSMIIADPGAFAANTPIVQLGDDNAPGAYSCRIENAYIYCNEVPGSIGVYSEKVQERSGARCVDVQRFGKKGYWFYGFGCQHFQMEQCGAGPGSQTVGDDAAIGIHLESAISANQINRCTTFGNPSISPYGVGIKLSNGSQCSLSDIHTESSYNGIEITGGSAAQIFTHTPGPGVVRGIVVSADSTARIDDGGTSLVDEGNSKKYASSLQGPVTIGNETTRLAGKSAQGGDVWYAENNGQNVRINRLGRLEIDAGNRQAPNILVFGAGPNFGGPNQGGFIGVNSQAAAYPDWIQVSDKILCSASASSDELTVTGEWPTSGLSRADYVGEHWTWTLADDSEVYVVGTDGASAGLPTELVFGTLHYVVNSDAATKTFQLSLTPGGGAINFTSDAAMIYITGSPYGGFYRIGATWFEFRSGNATNDEGANPGQMVLQARSDFGVRASRFFFYGADGMEQEWGNPFGANRARWSQGGTDQAEMRLERSVDSGANWTEGFVFHLEDGHLIAPAGVFPSGQRFAGFYAGSGSPEGALAAGLGSVYLDYANGDVWNKQTGASTTGWIKLSGLFFAIDANTVGVPYSVRLPSNRLLQWSSTTSASGTPDVGLSRSTFYANEVEVNNGTAGSWAGLTASLLRAGTTLALPGITGDRMLKNGSGQTAEGMTAADVRTFADLYAKSETYTKAEIAALIAAAVAGLVTASHVHAVSDDTGNESAAGDPHHHTYTTTTGTAF